MRTSKGGIYAIVLGAIGLAAPTLAHHSFAMFDQTTLKQESGTVKEFRWTNPHSFVILDVRGSKYVLECNSVNVMSRSGWKAGTLKPGDKLKITYYPLRNGQPGGMLKTAIVPDGRALSAW